MHKITKTYFIEQDSKLYTFDLFDTLITRKVANPVGIFSLIQNELLNNSKYKNIPIYIRENFVKLRMEIQDFLLTFKTYQQSSEVVLEEIYDYFMINKFLNIEERDLLYNLELETELKNLLPIKENIDIIVALIQANKNVAIVTDTYFNVKDLRFFISSVAKDIENVKIYASSYYNKTKRHNNIWQVVKCVENIEYSEWTHFGDNIIADVNNPAALGINTIQYEYYKLKDWENFIFHVLDNPFIQLSIGASKNVLLNKNEDKYTLGASYVGPMLFPFVHYIVDNAFKNGITDLYFIARDGYIIRKIADKIISYLNYKINTHYIYGSRMAWRVGSMTGANFDISYIPIIFFTYL